MNNVNSTTPIAFSGEIPVHYDAFLGPMFFEPFALDMADRVHQLKPKHILELASGTGRLTRLLPAAAGKDASITASDINPAMIAFGQQNVGNNAIQWHEVDAVHLPFGDATFDCIVVQFGVMFYSDRPAAFKEALRVLKPGGTFIFNCWDIISNNPMAAIANATLQHFFPENTPAFYSVPFSYYNEATILSDLEQAGFKDTSIELLELKGYSASARHAAKGMIEGTPTVTAILDRDETVLPTLLEYLEDKIMTTFGSGPFGVPLKARVVSARKI